jgi:hypothetical protein
MSCDVIGDIHGYADRLEALLAKLGYIERNGAWRHPSRTAIFVGDLIDRGPGQLRTLNIVRSMMDVGSARATMGNHEFNAIAWKHGLRPHSEKNRKQHQAFLTEVGEDSSEHDAWIDWFYALPLWIEEPGFRVVHACWSPRHVQTLRPHLHDGDRLTFDVVEEASRKGSDLYGAVETVLKGAEVALPAGVTFTDKEGHVRGEIRTRWWNPDLTTFSAAYIGPGGVEIPDISIPDYEPVPEPDRPTFVGHYWFEPDEPPAPASRKVVCVDYSAARGGPLVAYRFDGEDELSADKFVAV